MKKNTLAFSLSLTAVATMIGVAASLTPSNSEAANWLMLQGTEKPNEAPRAKLWGFVQLDYQQTDDTKLKSGPGKDGPAAFNQIGPQLSSASSFNVRRARIGVRGNNFPLDPKVNYFILAEFGNNGITTGGNASQGQLTDASVTLNHIPGARIRTGLFKTPGSEEGLQAAFTATYINFSNATNRLLLERSFDNSSGDSSRNAPVYAFRDTGVQVFDSFNIAGWDSSYAVMVGNGNGLAYTDNDSNKDVYLYASTEKVFGNSVGARRQGIKLYVWSQDGKRTIDDDQEHNRTRSGVGTTFWNGKFRAAAEYIQADGMIFGGTTGARTPENGGTFNVFTDQKADGYYLDVGYRLMPKVELDIRYDVLNSATEKDAASGTNVDKKRVFTTTTLGAQYFFNKKTSLKINYELRDIEAPDAPSSAPVQDILKGVDDRLSVQVTAVF